MSFEGFPFVVGWELTLACNLRCNHCASSAGLPRPRELTTEEALKICDQFPALFVQEVDFTGGEPLLRKDWMEIALYVRNLGITTNIVTNGLAVGSETVSEMQQVGIANVGISLDGLERTHDRIRGLKGSFQHVIKTIDLLQEADINVIVITTVNELNIHELSDILQLLQSLGVRLWRLQPLMPLGRVKNFKELEISSQGILKLGNFIRDWTPKVAAKGLQIICSDGLEYIEGTEMPHKPWCGCPGGVVACGITSDGKVKGCLSLPDNVVVGDLRKNDLWDIWFHPESFAYSRNFLLNQLGANCISCDKGSECKGGCSASSYAATGEFHNDPYCFYKINKNNNCC
ncbi:MAG: radical SAM protein [Desulfobaccales bacterium]